MELFSFLIGLLIIIACVFLIRLFGAWMFRIDEIIKYQKLILNELKKGTDEENH